MDDIRDRKERETPMELNKSQKKKFILIAVLVFAAVLSILLSGPLSSPETHRETIQSLDEKKTTILELAAASTAASVAITTIPGDTATPVADKLADLTSYFLLIVSAIFLEKYLVTITGYAAFRFLFPLACGLGIVFLCVDRKGWRDAAIRIAAFSAALFLLVPVSVRVSNLIEATYQDSIQSTIDAALELEEEAEAETAQPSEETDNQNWLQSQISGAKNALNDLKESIVQMPEKLEGLLNHFIEALAVLIVTSCLIPILVMLLFFWIIKIFLGVEGQGFVSRSS